eukprot:10915086-Karenia_brevis.AAC.1
MKEPAEALLSHLRNLSETTCGDQPVLVLSYLDDVIVAVPDGLVDQVVPLATAALGHGLSGAPGGGLELEIGKLQ